MFVTHPDLEQLSRFSEGADAPRRRRMAAHLERCQRCRDSLAYLKDVGDALNRLPAAQVPPGLRKRIEVDRAAGTRVILPVADPARASRRPLARAAAILLAVAAGAALLGKGTDAVAFGTSGELTLSPDRPTAGATIHVTYRPGDLLDGHRPLLLRARYRTRTDDSYNWGIATHTVATFEGEVPFEARFVLPDSVVYAAFVVEDTAGTIIDDNMGRLWELIVSDETGKPSYDALDQRHNDMMGRNWEEGLATARAMVRHYPERIDAWSLLRAFHNWSGLLDHDSIQALHRGKVREFAARTDLTDTELGQLAWYADERTDSALAADLKARLIREAPANTFAVQWRMLDILIDLHRSRDTARASAALEALWPDAPRERRLQVAGYASRIAWETEDTALISRWTDRQIRHHREPQAMERIVAERFTRLPALRSEGMARLRRAIAALDTLPPDSRGLVETVEEHRARFDARRRGALATLGRALLAEGHRQAALDTLALAVEGGWDLALFKEVAGARLEAGDTAGALEMHALLAADPRTDASALDSLQPLIRASAGDAWWHEQLRQAKMTFRQRMLARAESRPVEPRARIADAGGATHRLGDVLRGRTSLVVFWSRFCFPAVEELPRVNAVAATLVEQGVQVLSIVEEEPSEELEQFVRDKDLGMPVYHSVQGEAGNAFNQWGTPAYYIVDARGRVRFDYASPVEELLAQVEALRLEAVASGR